ncbi:hypothetical protein EJV47_15970 [Hymenobacter gummosus]|uniref:Uncharacterized protein n=1 Tax=Hymenobacter gummosus TaxID=1776032 RepID=A0A431U095_9BACT|nr:hypothetical protein [Hymenobacter gummosus]RTQ48468.1 hypothetical protein EJV47_15970 [Hymenobacter gummosus]
MIRYLLLATGLLLMLPAAAQSPAKPAAKPGPVPAAAPRALLRGTWQATDDKNALLTITDQQYIERYAGQPDEARSLQVLNRPCDAPPAAKPGNELYLQTRGSAADDVMCYYVVSVTATRLQLSPVGGRGNTLTYKRVTQSPGKKQGMP